MVTPLMPKIQTEEWVKVFKLKIKQILMKNKAFCASTEILGLIDLKKL